MSRPARERRQSPAATGLSDRLSGPCLRTVRAGAADARREAEEARERAEQAERERDEAREELRALRERLERATDGDSP